MFWMPLYTEGEGGCFGDTYRFDDAIVADGFDENAVARPINRLRMERIDHDPMRAIEQFFQ